MQAWSVIAVFCGAGAGALCRWWLGLLLNPIFPTLPLGTLAANLGGGLVMGVALALFEHFQTVTPATRLLVTTGFLGGLTTFSTFSAETSLLLLRQQFGWSAVLVAVHVAGSVLCTLAGLWIVRLVLAAYVLATNR